MAQAVGFNPENPIGFKEITWANLQLLSVVDYKRCTFFCPDAPGGGSAVMSDGIRWRPFALGISRNKRVLIAADNGSYTFSYNQGWTQPAAPDVILIDGGAQVNQGILSTRITSATKDGVTVTVTRSINVLGVLTLGGGDVTGVTIFVIAWPMEN